MKLFESQQKSQQLWRLKPNQRHLTIFDQLLGNEFADSGQRQERINQRTREMFQFATSVVPFYKKAINDSEQNISDFSGIKDLPCLPIIDKATVQKQSEEFLAQQLPKGIQPGAYISTSGSTGQPLKVLHSINSIRFFSILKQREYRIWDYDPQASMVSIRPASDLPLVNGKLLQDGEELTLDNWMFVGNFFYTGSFKGFNDMNPIDEILAWLEKQSACYLLSMAATLEHIALGHSKGGHELNLLGAVSISQQLTEGMRELVESSLHTPVQQNYGLNEIGVVAVRCPESGYYHIHNEHCVIEVVNEKGERCQAGESGRLLVSGLNNYSMPLLRYDTDDLATVPVDACPCGRSMQSFTNLMGRYRRTAHLPAGTWDYWDTLLGCLSKASSEEVASIEQYQLHQLSENNFHLKIKSPNGLAASLRHKIIQTWSNTNPEQNASLTIIEMDSIPMKTKKFQNFISDLVPSESL